jgi:hypothetical protein
MRAVSTSIDGILFVEGSRLVYRRNFQDSSRDMHPQKGEHGALTYCLHMPSSSLPTEQLAGVKNGYYSLPQGSEQFCNR